VKKTNTNELKTVSIQEEIHNMIKNKELIINRMGADTNERLLDKLVVHLKKKEDNNSSS
jgi:hypothetical protein